MNDVRLVALRAYHARVKLRRPIRHAGHARDANDTLLVRAELSDGSVGWGEGLPRDYVTGETMESTLDAWRSFDATTLFDARDTDLFEAAGRLPFRIDGRRIHALRAAVEIALLDAFGKAVGRPVGDLLADGKPRPESVRYGVVLPLTKRWKADALARVSQLAGVRDVKLKVGLDHAADVAACRRLKRILGEHVDLRVDVNGVWSADDWRGKLADLADAGVGSVEQPLPSDRPEALDGTAGRLPVPVLLDESFVDEADADNAIGHNRGDGWNVRVSKCGGMLPSLGFLRRAGQNGLVAQLGCMVGETGILSAAGRHVAAAAAAIGRLPRHVEGSFDRFLVRDRLTHEDMTFRWGGVARVPERPGLGVTVDESAVARITVWHDERAL